MRRISVLLRLTLSPRCLSIPHLDADFSGQAATLWITEKVPHAKRSYWNPSGGQRATWALSRKSRTFSPSYCSHGDDLSHGFFHSHWHTEPLSETFSSKPFETLWQSCPKALPWSSMCLCSNAGRNAHTSLYLPCLPRDPNSLSSSLAQTLWNTQTCSMKALTTMLSHAWSINLCPELQIFGPSQHMSNISNYFSSTAECTSFLSPAVRATSPLPSLPCLECCIFPHHD